jgi:hypothetical protein
MTINQARFLVALAFWAASLAMLTLSLLLDVHLLKVLSFLFSLVSTVLLLYIAFVEDGAAELIKSYFNQNEE